VCFLSPHVDGYKTTPAAKVRTGAADVAIAPPETVISSHSPRESWAAPVKLKARPHSSGYLGIILDVTPRAGSAGDVVLCSVRPLHWAWFCGEPLISCATGNRPVWLQAVAALLQDDTSAIVTLESSGIDRPAKLDGCVYASYGARCGRRNWGTLLRALICMCFPLAAPGA